MDSKAHIWNVWKATEYVSSLLVYTIYIIDIQNLKEL